MSRLSPLYLCVGLLLLTVAAYAPLRHNDFVDFDDEKYITTNPEVSRGLSLQGLRWAWTNYDGNYWMPISWLSLQLDAHLFSTRLSAKTGGQRLLSPLAFHLDNLFWHAASVLLLFGLLNRLTAAPWRSFGVAALFAVHPMHVESVAWAAERKDVLSCFFGLMTLWAYVHYVQEPGRKRYLGLSAAYLLSLLSKPTLMTLPFVLLLLDYWPLRRMASRAAAPAERKEQRGLAWLVLEKVPLLALAAAVGVLTLLFREKTGSVVPLSLVPWPARLANALSAYRWYLWETVCPVQLMCLYPHPGINWSVRSAVEGAVLLLVLTALAFWQARRRPWLLVGWLWFVGTLVPVLGLAQGGLQAWADRFSYWPHIGLFVAAVWGAAEVVERLRVPQLAAGAAGAIVLLCLGAATWVQVGYWRNTATLWERALAVQKDNEHAHVHLGVYYLSQDQLDKAEPHLVEAVRLAPYLPDFQNYLGVALLSLGKEEEAAGHFQEAVQRDQDNADYWHNLGIAELRQGRPDALAKAALCFRKVLQLQPGSSDAEANLGLALWRAGKRQEAASMFQDILRRDPASADAWYGLGLAKLGQGQLDEAVKAFSSSLRLQNKPATCSELGVALGRQGQWSSAASLHSTAVQSQEQANRRLEQMNGRPPELDSIPYIVLYRCRLAHALHQLGDRRASEEYAAALGYDIRWPEKFKDKAWKLAADPDSNRRDPHLAFELASQAAEAVTEPSASLLDALAAAQAALGQYSEAVQTAKRALAKATSTSDPNLSQAIRRRLERYTKGLPAAEPGT